VNIIVCIKQVPDTTDVKIDPKTGTLIREGVPSIINPEDKNALEAALALKDKHGGKVTVMTMGPPQADDALREASAMGADELVLLSDRAFAGADTLATSYAVAMGIKAVKDYDLVLCGRQAIDGDTAQIGPQVAEFLGIPQVTYCQSLEVKDGKLVAERALEDGYEKVEAKLPALVTCLGELNSPRYPTILGINLAYKEKEVKVWNAEHIKADPSLLGANGSPTQVKKTFAPEPKGKGEMIEGTTAGELAGGLLAKLLDRNVIRGV